MTKKHVRLLTHIGFSCMSVMCVAFASSLLLLLVSCQQPIGGSVDEPPPISQPNVPGEPEESKTPDAPATPDTPVTHDAPATPDTPVTPDTPTSGENQNVSEFGTVEELLTYLENSKENSVANPYLVKLTGLDLSDEAILKSLYGALSRFVNLDLSACVGESIPKITLTQALNKANIVSIKLPESVKTIAAAAFSELENLKSIDMPGVITIEGKDNSSDTSNGAFAKCPALTSVSLPKVKSLGKYAFYGCSALPSILLPEVETIGASTFKDCSNLAPMSLPQAITFIGNNAFQTGTDSLFTSITLVSEPPELGGTQVFNGFTTLYVPVSMLEAYKNTEKANWTKALKSRVIAI